MGNLYVVGPNECIIVSGGVFSSTRLRIIVGGWIWVWRYLSHVQKLSLCVMTLIPRCDEVHTLLGVPLNVSGVCQCKIKNEICYIRSAAEQFSGKNIHQIKQTILLTIEGHLRAILSTLTVEEVYKDIEKFAAQVREVASPDVREMGIDIISFTISDIHDTVQYLSSLGKKQTAIVKKVASIGIAEANRDAGIAESQFQKESKEIQYSMFTAIEYHLKCYRVHNYFFKNQINTALAESEHAYELQVARLNQQIRFEQIEIDVIERSKQIDIEQQEVARKELELHSTVRFPAEGEKYREQLIAQGKKAVTIETAWGESHRIRNIGFSIADADELKGVANAETMKLKAEVFKNYGSTAIASLVLRVLPKITANVVRPLANIEDIVILGQVDNITTEVNRLIGQLPPSIKALTGLNLKESLYSNTSNIDY